MNNNIVYDIAGKIDERLLNDLQLIWGSSSNKETEADTARRQLLYLRCVKASITILEDKYLAQALEPSQHNRLTGRN
jgi:hypothetical protein